MGMDIVPSRYKKTAIYLMLNDDMTIKPVMGFRNTTLDNRYLVGSIYHRLRSGESLQDVAVQYYGAPEYWSVIADANPEIFCPMDLSGLYGTQIRVPDPVIVRNL